MDLELIVEHGREIAAEYARLAEKRREVTARGNDFHDQATEQEKRLRQMRTAFAMGGEGAPSADEIRAAADELRHVEALQGGVDRAIVELRIEQDRLRPKMEALEVLVLETVSHLVRERVEARNREEAAWLDDVLEPIRALAAPATTGVPLDQFLRGYLPRIGAAKVEQPPHDLRLTMSGGARVRLDPEIDSEAARTASANARSEARKRLGLEQEVPS